MDDSERFRLLGTYRTPRFRLGQTVRCEVRGEVVAPDLSDGPIPWSVGRRRPNQALVVYQGLARAVRKEAALAVAHWWGVHRQTVWAWRKALRVGPSTEGTARLRHDWGLEPHAARGREAARDKARDPARREKIAAARRGKPRPPHVVEAVAAAHRGTRHTEEARRKMSEAHRRRRGTAPAAGNQG